MTAPESCRALAISIHALFIGSASFHYSQGLVYESDGTFIEGTGLYGQSTVRRVDAKTGHTTQNIPVDSKFFGGCTNGRGLIMSAAPACS